jgi:hypothetical protein
MSSSPACPVTRAGKARLLALAAAAVVALAPAALLSSCGRSWILAALEDGAKAKLESVVGRVSQDRMYADLEALEAGAQLFTSINRRDYAIAVFASVGLEVIHDTDQSDPEMRIDTIYVDLPGSDPGLAPVMIQAHWDRIRDREDTSVDPPAWTLCPAMDDDASGLVGVLECARAVVESGLRFRHTLRFVLYDKEEEGLLGSKAFAATMAATGSLPSFFVNLEMIAFTASSDKTMAIAHQSSGDYIQVFAPDWAADCPPDFARAAELFSPGLKFYAAAIPANYAMDPLIANIGRSDHAPFWALRVPGLMVTDGAELRNPNYHEPTDRLATLDLGFMSKVVKACLAVALLRAEPD